MNTETPFVFNSLKHHLESVKYFLKAEINNYNEIEFTKTLLTLGESQMDFYYGKLSTSEIFKEINTILSINNIWDYVAYNKWLKDNNEFIPVTLSDSSLWILRSGMDQNNFIHIHPGRYSPLTLRVKANKLKTAIATKVISSINNLSINLSTINFTREKIIKLPPIKSLSDANGVKRIIQILTTD